MKRIVIHPKDIMIITGKSERYARYLIKQIKEELNKKSHQYVTIKECADYLGIEEKDIISVLGN